MTEFRAAGRRANLKVLKQSPGYDECVKLVENGKLEAADWRWDGELDALWINIHCYWERKIVASRIEADNQKGR